MKFFRGQRTAVGSETGKIEGDINGKRNPQAIDQHGIGEGKADGQESPELFSSDVPDKGKDQQGNYNAHKLEAAAGGGNDAFQAVIYIARSRFTDKGDAGENCNPVCGRRQNPQKVCAVRPPVEQF